MQLKKILLGMLLFPVMLTSCLDDDAKTHIRATSYIPIEADQMPDTVFIYTPLTVNLYSHLGNTCWKMQQFMKMEVNDTVFAFASAATFESYGFDCDSADYNYDTTFVITPTTLHKHLFKFYSCDTLMRVDTVVVIQTTR